MNPPFRPCVALFHEHHECPPGDHYDWLFETSDGTDPDERSLLAFRVNELPGELSEHNAIRLSGHRRHYLTYEGPISGDLGRVTRVWTGEARVTESGDTFEFEIRSHGGADESRWLASPISGDEWRFVRTDDPH